MGERLWVFLWLPVLCALYKMHWLQYLPIVIVVCGLYEIFQRKPNSVMRWLAVGQIMCLAFLYWMPAKNIIFLVLVVVANDMFAYIGGKYLKFFEFMKTPIFPKTSPNKTVGGFIYGLVFGTLTGYAFISYVGADWKLTFFALLVCLLAVAGDYFESSFKRFYKIKDSGQGLFTGLLLYGHGGVYDRFDAIALAAPFVWLMHGLF